MATLDRGTDLAEHQRWGTGKALAFAVPLQPCPENCSVTQGCFGHGNLRSSREKETERLFIQQNLILQNSGLLGMWCETETADDFCDEDLSSRRCA